VTRGTADPDAVLRTGEPTPTDAFDALYASCASALVRQVYLLCGRRGLAHDAVIRAFRTAWHRWPEVAVDPDPPGWVRAVAYDCALSPWRRLLLRHRRPERPEAPPADRDVLSALRSLPPYRRRALLLHEAVGLDLAGTAAETEASTPVTANRLFLARESVTERLPRLTGPDLLHDRLADVAAVLRVRTPRPAEVRAAAERRARLWTYSAAAVTAALVAAVVIDSVSR
jgi:DNA-directed RNA polymerase specialized sigma24 family protein